MRLVVTVLLLQVRGGSRGGADEAPVPVLGARTLQLIPRPGLDVFRRGGRDRGRRPHSNRFVEPNPPDLQNRQAHVTHALVGSTHAPVRQAESSMVERFGS